MSHIGRNLQRCWHLVDAKRQTVGRLATQVASILRGKHKPTYTPNHDMGDNVIIINAAHVKLTGKKWKKKLYRWHTGYPGGLKERTAETMHYRKPTEVLRKAIIGMIPKNRMRKTYIIPRLKIFPGSTHPHTAQLPDSVEPLPKSPKMRRGDFHFGLKYYAHPESHLDGRVSRDIAKRNDA